MQTLLWLTMVGKSRAEAPGNTEYTYEKNYWFDSRSDDPGRHELYLGGRRDGETRRLDIETAGWLENARAEQLKMLIAESKKTLDSIDAAYKNIAEENSFLKVVNTVKLSFARQQYNKYDIFIVNL